MNLLEIKDNEMTVIKDLPKNEAGPRLEALGIRVGKRIKKVSCMPFGGPVTVVLDGRQFAISHGISEQITVEPLGPALPGSEDER